MLGHLKHKGYCTCGRVVSGNGGQHSHRAMHERRQDGHRFMTYSQYLASKPIAPTKL